MRYLVLRLAFVSCWTLVSNQISDRCSWVFNPCDSGLPVGRNAPDVWILNSSRTMAYVKTGAKHKPLRPFRGTRIEHDQKGPPELPSSVEMPKLAGSHKGWTLGVHANEHDPNLAVGHNGRVLCILELERITGRRYGFMIEGDDRMGTWTHALWLLMYNCRSDGLALPKEFETGVIVQYSTHYTIFRVPQWIDAVFHVKNWRTVNHHEAHALYGYHASPFRSALVVSYDAAGNDGCFEIFLGLGLKLHRIASLANRVGGAYLYLSSMLPEVTGNPPPVLNTFCRHASLREHQDDFVSLPISVLNQKALRSSFPGKLMGYAATGDRLPELDDLMRHYWWNRTDSKNVPLGIVRKMCESTQGQRDVAASIQGEFESYIQHIIADLLAKVSVERKVEGIVLVGGVAQNVGVNQVVRDTLTRSSNNQSSSKSGWLPFDVFVPPAPNDAGLGVGALWTVEPPLMQHPLQYLGFPLWDLHILEKEAQLRGASSLSALGGVDYLADLLAGGSAWSKDPNRFADYPIIAIVRGRQEFGPRALGHRSLVAVPVAGNVKDRLNRLKMRQWFRPVAPMIADEALHQVFGTTQKSPYMSMAPRLLDDVKQRFPGLAHLDGTARHQSVGKNDEPWLHALLHAVGKRIGLAALINTSFNSKGRPITNTVRESLDMLDNLPDLDYVLIEDWLFRAPAKAPPDPLAPLSGFSDDDVFEVHYGGPFDPYEHTASKE